MEGHTILLFAGTTEGRALFETLDAAGIATDLSVATEYGKELAAPACRHGRILTGRLAQPEMENLLHRCPYDVVVDATHPYAVEVTKNIQGACAAAGVPYLRLLRKEDTKNMPACSVFCADISQAVHYLSGCKGNILSTVGSKELAALAQIPDYARRVFPRILPLASALDACRAMGFPSKNLICMQGPFSYEMNLAMLRQYDCRYLLTKNSGPAGGFLEKCRAAQEAGAQLVVVERPAEQGLSFLQMLRELERWFGVRLVPPPQRHTHFPLFLPTQGKTALVVGGGTVGARRAATLCRFCWQVRVVSPAVDDAVLALWREGALQWAQKRFDPSDLDGVALVVAATNDRRVNALVGALAREKEILVSVADCRAECTFYFPAIAEQDTVVAGIGGDGESHQTVARAAKTIREALRQ